MTLEMKALCERCGTSLSRTGEAYICTYECTFCPACTRDMEARCPNCGGELVRRPRANAPIEAPAAGDSSDERSSAT